jgi:hypothetical protein
MTKMMNANRMNESHKEAEKLAYNILRTIIQDAKRACPDYTDEQIADIPEKEVIAIEMERIFIVFDEELGGYSSPSICAAYTKEEYARDIVEQYEQSGNDKYRYWYESAYLVDGYDTIEKLIRRRIFGVE